MRRSPDAPACDDVTRRETAPVLAPAKINLALHVTGRRADGYHLLDSLVVFTALGIACRSPRRQRPR